MGKGIFAPMVFGICVTAVEAAETLDIIDVSLICSTSALVFTFVLLALYFDSVGADSTVLTGTQRDSDEDVIDDPNVVTEVITDPNPALDPPISSSLDLRQRDFTLTGFEESESYPVAL